MKRPPPLSAMSQIKVDVVPEGWFTTADCAKSWNLSRARTFFLIRQSIESKKCEMRKFRIMTTGRGIFPVHHYRFK
jgi:hypothetical protein